MIIGIRTLRPTNQFQLRSYSYLLLFLFFLSGGIGLTAEIIWTRMLLLVFGSTVYSVVIVLSTFMAGLAVGSFVLGRIADRQKNPLRFYALLELGVGISTLSTIFFIPLIRDGYQLIYGWYPHEDIQLLVKCFLSFLTLFPATFLMGGTFPTFLRFFIQHRKSYHDAGLLYAVNTVGAACGTIFTGFFFIELLGLHTTLLLSSMGNLFIGVSIFFLRITQSLHECTVKKAQSVELEANTYSQPKIAIAVAAFAISGMLSMAYEVAWVRLLTPSTGTYIYAFSFILALFLVGIAWGSFAFRHIKGPGFLKLLGIAELGIGLCALLTLIVTSQLEYVNVVLKVLLAVLPATFLMGSIFPIVMGMFSSYAHAGRIVGTTYAANTIGGIVGPVVAGFILLPLFGTTRTILILGTLNLVLGAVLIMKENRELVPHKKAVGLFLAFAVILFSVGILQPSLFLEKSLADDLRRIRKQDYTYAYLEDETASVLAYNRLQFRDATLKVDGIAMTGLVEETKLMAHLPLLVHPHPTHTLVIAFGMGTTFRSALTHGVTVDAVELVPSVPKTFPIFYQDASAVLQNPNGRIIINDGRNYTYLTQKRYDVIVVDPPPPLNSAHTTLLYSKEFYEQGKKILNKEGIFTQWIYFDQGNKDDIAMLAKSFLDVFPYVSVWQSPNDFGMFLLGSMQPLTIDKDTITKRYESKDVFRDMNEFRQVPYTPAEILTLYKGEREILTALIARVPSVTDDRPRTEYFILRRAFFPGKKFLTIEELLE